MKLISVKTILGLSGLLLMAACTNELVDSAADGARAISFQTPQTRAAVSDATGMRQDGFKVWSWYTMDGTSDVTQVFDGIPVSYSDAKGWFYDNVQYWTPGATYVFYGLFPAALPNVSCSAEDGPVVTTFDTSGNFGEAAVDLMTAQTRISYESGEQSVQMPFQHELCKVKFTVKAEPGISATTVNKMVLFGYKNQGAYSFSSEAKWSLNGDPCSAENSAMGFTGEHSLTETNPLESNVWLLIPQRSELQFTLGYTKDGSYKDITQKISETGTVNWIAGKAYHYVITIKSNAITFAEFVVEEWGSASTGGDIVIP